MKTNLLIPAVLLALLCIVALAAPFMGLPDPAKMNIVSRFAGPSLEHLLGTDEYGRDVGTRLLLGARISLIVAFSSAALACLFGTALGLLGAYYRGLAEFFALRTTDVLLCFPPLLLALLVVTLFGPGASTLIPILAIVYTPGFARVAYSGALSARGNDYVVAARVLGAGDGAIMGRTILPNIAGPILVQFSLTVAAAVTLESGLSFLGLGVVPPEPSWGLMIAGARATMMQAPQLLLWPCLALTATILLMNWFCDAMRDNVDPQPVVRPGRGLLGFLAPGLFSDRSNVLEVRDLSIAIGPQGEGNQPVRNVSFAVRPGETVAVVGESGSGKSLTSLAIMGLLPVVARPAAGAVWLGGEDLLRAAPERLRALRGNKVSMIFQDPASSLNPVYRVGEQIAESLRAHGYGGDIDARVLELLRDVGIPDPTRRAQAYPHQLSGGMRQRVVIAIALANEPDLLIADEPTTALDVTVQAQILRLLKQIQLRSNTAILFITHSLPVVRQVADRVVVLYAGEVLEEGTTRAVFSRPRHPYTRALLDSAPREDGTAPKGIDGSVPMVHNMPAGCVFAPRCPMAIAACQAHPPLMMMEDNHLSRCIRWSEL